MLIHSVPEKVAVFWNPSVKALVSKWENYYISNHDFSEAIVGAALAHGARNGVRAWIVDASDAEGAMPLDIVRTMENEVFPTLIRYGVTHLIVIKPSSSNLTKISVAAYVNKAAAMGLKLVEAESMKEAIKWLMLNRINDEQWAN